MTLLFFNWAFVCECFLFHFWREKVLPLQMQQQQSKWFIMNSFSSSLLYLVSTKRVCVLTSFSDCIVAWQKSLKWPQWKKSVETFVLRAKQDNKSAVIQFRLEYIRRGSRKGLSFSGLEGRAFTSWRSQRGAHARASNFHGQFKSDIS